MRSVMLRRSLLAGLALAGFLAAQPAKAFNADIAEKIQFDEVYHHGSYGFIYDGKAIGMRIGQRWLVKRGEDAIGFFRILTVNPGITRGRFEPMQKNVQLRRSDMLVTVDTVNPELPKKGPDWHMIPNPAFGLTMPELIPYQETGSRLDVGFMPLKSLAVRGGFQLDGDQMSRGLMLTPRKGYSLALTRYDAKLSSTTGGTGTVDYTLGGLYFTREQPASYISKKLQPSLGVVALNFGNARPETSNLRFVTYALLRHETGSMQTWFGVSMTGGTGFGTARPSLLLGLARPIMGRTLLTLGYASRDYMKDLVYNSRLPLESDRLGFGLPLSCLNCRRDALSLSLDYSLGRNRDVRLGLYDLMELKAPSVTLQGKF